MKKHTERVVMGFVSAVGPDRRAAPRAPESFPRAEAPATKKFLLPEEKIASYDAMTAANGFSMEAALERLGRVRKTMS